MFKVPHAADSRITLHKDAINTIRKIVCDFGPNRTASYIVDRSIDIDFHVNHACELLAQVDAGRINAFDAMLAW